MAVFRIIALLIAAAACAGSSTGPSHMAGSTPNDWRTYDLLDVRNPGTPVAMIEYRHHRTGPSTVAIQTHLLLRSGSRWRDATPHRLKWWIEDAYFLNRNHGWLVSNDCAAAKGTMYRTRTGGRTWRQLPWAFGHGCAAGSGFRLTFVDRKHGWVMAPEPTAPGGSVFRTRDGGRSWAQNNTSTTGIPVLGESVFTSPRRGWAIGQPWLLTEPLYGTSDAGRTWKPVTGLPRAHYSLPAVFRHSAVVMGRRRAIATFYRRSFAGRNWRVLNRLDVPGLRFSDFRGPTERNWWVFGVLGSTPIAFVTTDAGRSWMRSSIHTRAYEIRLASTGRHAWLTTTPLQGEGALFSSADMGRTWTRVTP
jgi:photosystem II stability/assembly factor-like uncharacterized protein